MTDRRPPHEASDADIDALLAGRPVSDDLAPVASVFDVLRTDAVAAPPPRADARLQEFVTSGGRAPQGATISSPQPGVTAPPPRRAGRRAAQLAMAGLVLIGGVAGAQASGLTDLPGLPDRDSSSIVVAGPVDTGEADSVALAPATSTTDDDRTVPGDDGPTETDGPGLSVSIEDDGIDIEVTGRDQLDSACLAAVEAIEGAGFNLDDGAMDTTTLGPLLSDLEAACLPELEKFLEQFEIDAEALEAHLEELETALDGVDLGELEQLVEALDNAELEQLIEDFGGDLDLSDLPDLSELPEIPDLPSLDGTGLDLDQLESELETMLDDLGIDLELDLGLDD